MQKKLIVIGGGAAGFFCAVNASRLNPQLDVTILEKSNKLLSKVKVSGGGRCNITNACFSIAEMSRQYPRGSNFVKKAFHRFFTTDTIQWFEKRGVKLKAEADGRMFPVTDSSQTIIDCLMNEAGLHGVKVKMNSEVSGLKYNGKCFQLNVSGVGYQEPGHQIQTADLVCIASGGYTKLAMYDWFRELGHSVEVPVPSLFTFNMPKHPITQLMGISVKKVKVKIAGSKLEQVGPLLITHWGFSGPAILKLSAWGARELREANWEFGININWLPGIDENHLKEKFQQLRFEIAAQKISNKNPFGLPKRLWDFLVNKSQINAESRWADLPAKGVSRLIKSLSAGEFQINGKTTFKEEFVTSGGIKLSEVEHETMMSKMIPHLYFAGEILNVDGITGGFNFQHAWTSGFIAAESIAREVDIQ